MDKSFIEKRINERAEGRLKQEYADFIKVIWNSKFVKNIKIGEEDGKGIYLRQVYSNSKTIYPDKMNDIEDEQVLELVENRRKELIKEETDLIFSKLDSVAYLFNQ